MSLESCEHTEGIEESAVPPEKRLKQEEKAVAAASRSRTAPPIMHDLKSVLKFHFSGPKRLEGRVKWFDKEKGFGKIAPLVPRGSQSTFKQPEDIFVHRNQIDGGVDGHNYAAVASGALVTYELGSQADGKPCAEKVRCEGLAKIIQHDLAVVADAKSTKRDEELFTLVLSKLLSGAHQEVGQGKVLMEDRFIQGAGNDVGLLGTSKKHASCAIVGVCDGHGGVSCSDFVALHMERSIFECLREQKKRDANSEMTIRSSLLAGFRVTEHNFFQYANKLEGGAKRAWEASGSTACMAALYGPDEDGHLRLLIANVGDSRAVLGKKDGLAVRLSTDHKPEVPSEKKRVEQQGGTVAQFGGAWRVILKSGRGQVTSGLSVTRSIGDVDFKNPLEVVTAVPEISSFKLDPDDDAFIIVASDGVWSSLSDSEAVRIVGKSIVAHDGDRALAPGKAARILVETAHARNGNDDKTALVVWFGTMPVLTNEKSSLPVSVANASSIESIDLIVPEVVETKNPNDDIFADGTDPVELELLDDIFSGYAREMGMPVTEGSSMPEPQQVSQSSNDPANPSKRKTLSGKVAKKVF